LPGSRKESPQRRTCGFRPTGHRSAPLFAPPLPGAG
jgi:hypothetical protein